MIPKYHAVAHQFRKLLYQCPPTEKYLYEKALRKVAVIISRSGPDEHALQAVKGSLRENGKLIICLSDNSLLEMIDIKDRGEQEPAEFLGAILDDLLVHLEK